MHDRECKACGWYAHPGLDEVHNCPKNNIWNNTWNVDVSTDRLAELENENAKLRAALEYYENFQWRRVVFQYWPFTRTDVVSRRATEALRGADTPEGEE